MRVQMWAESRLRLFALLIVLVAPLQAAAGVQFERFGYFKIQYNDSGAPIGGTSFIDTFDGGPAGTFEWLTRVGTSVIDDAAPGLYLDPGTQGAPFNIGPYATRSQILELQTPLTGAAAINSERSNFFVFAVYELSSYSHPQVAVGVGLTDVFRGAGTRGVAATIERDGDSYYRKFSNALTGEIWDRQLLNLPAEAQYVEAFLERENLTSDYVRAGYGLRDASFNLIGPVTYASGLGLAFSDVVLSPVIFAAVPIPEAETWFLLLVGLAIVGCRVRAQRR